LGDILVKYRVSARVKKLIGKCPSGNCVDDRFEFSRKGISDCKCLSALHSIYPVAFAMKYGAELPWLENKDIGFVECPDPEHQVIFELRREKI